jgi:predicted Zn finger-like uncharacterized protein
MPSVIACPSCQKQLKVPDELIGRNVKCPGCKETFTAQLASKSAPPQEEIVERPSKRAAPPPDEEDDEPRRPVRRRDDDDDEERDDERDARPSRRRRRSGRRLQEHRGGLIMTLGILGFFVGPCGPIAWIMGNNDLKEMDAGRMDPEGRSQTQTGRLCGMISTIMLIVSLVIGCLVPVMLFGGCALCGIGGAAGGGGN